jgi:CRP-like cAMP-binding protein
MGLHIRDLGAARVNGSEPAKLREADERSNTLHRAMLRYAHAYLLQTTATALANGRSNEERLARWLLMARDRVGDDRLPLTHEFLSLMLGVRRAGVTAALQVLEKKGLTPGVGQIS